MATRLYRTLSFQGLAVGIPVSIPHGINIDERPQIPNLVIPGSAGFTVTTDAVNVTVTRLPNAPPAVDVWVMALHSYLRAYDADPDLSIRPFIVDPGDVVAPAPSTLIFQPGGPDNGPVVFNDWFALYAQLQALRAQANGSGLYTIAFDNEFVSPVVVPVGTYDMAGCRWTAFLDPDPAGGFINFVTINLADGVVLQNLFDYDGAMRVVSLGTVISPVTLQNNELYFIRNRADIRAGAAAPYFDGSALPNPGAVTFLLDSFTILGDGVNDVYSFPVAGSGLFLTLGVAARVTANALNFAIGSFLSVTWRSSSAAIDGTQPAFLGTLSQTQLVLDRWRIRAATGAAIVADFGDAIGSTPPIGGQTVTLPLITPFSSGQDVMVSRLNAANALSIVPQAGQTINGGALIAPAGLQSVLLVADGGTNWRALIGT